MEASDFENRCLNPFPFPASASRAIPRTNHPQTITFQVFNPLPVFYLTA
jgi:hypothetical protein